MKATWSKYQQCVQKIQVEVRSIFKIYGFSNLPSIERSPLPREIYKNKVNEDGTVWNIYNFSPHAVEKRKKMRRASEEMLELHSSDIIPRILDLHEKTESINSIPLLLNKSLSEGWDPFESVKRSLSNGTLQREKIFSKIKVNDEIRIGGQAGSNFNPFVRVGKPSHRTASSSYDSNLNSEESELKAKRNLNCEISQNLNRNVDPTLLTYLDNYSTDVLQKTALVILEHSLARSKSFQDPAGHKSSLKLLRSSNTSENSSKNEASYDDGAKPCNCRKSKCLKLYCECFSNGRKCTSKCDCSPCCNTPAHEDLIAKSKSQIMQRNPDAFKPKFSEKEESKETVAKKHQRGWNCQKSGCLKKYCECYQMGVECSDLCRCVGCHNCVDKNKSGDRLMQSQPLAEINLEQSAYTLKPRRAKENRYIRYEDYAVELNVRK